MNSALTTVLLPVTLAFIGSSDVAYLLGVSRALAFHFGFTPLTSLDPANEVPGRSELVSKVIRLLAKHGSATFPAGNQSAYQEKWGLDLIEPEYVAFQGRVSIRAPWSLLRLTNSV